MPQHILTANQFGRDELDDLFHRVDWMKAIGVGHVPHDLAGKTVCLLFYEPSTRTRMSFEFAARYLGAGTITTEAAGLFSSAAKGETIEDTVRVLASYDADAIVIRHKERGMSARAAAASPVPVLNAGDGGDEHPTQALLDLYTMLRGVKRQTGISVTLCGDLEHSRTVRSLCRLMIRYANGDPDLFRITLCSPKNIQLGEDVKQELAIAGIPFDQTSILPRAMRNADVFYQTRVQMERFGTDAAGNPTAEALEAHRTVQDRFRLDAKSLTFLKDDAIILHPLPRTGEIAPEVDADPRARYFPEQTRNGLFVRMALLKQLLAPDDP